MFKWYKLGSVEDMIEWKIFRIFATNINLFFKCAGTKVMCLLNGVVPCNRHILELIDLIKPKIRDLADDSNVVRC